MRDAYLLFKCNALVDNLGDCEVDGGVSGVGKNSLILQYCIQNTVTNYDIITKNVCLHARMHAHTQTHTHTLKKQRTYRLLDFSTDKIPNLQMLENLSSKK